MRKEHCHPGSDSRPIRYSRSGGRRSSGSRSGLWGGKGGIDRGRINPARSWEAIKVGHRNALITWKRSSAFRWWRHQISSPLTRWFARRVPLIFEPRAAGLRCFLVSIRGIGLGDPLSSIVQVRRGRRRAARSLPRKDRRPR